jgi:hypothetical protein
MPEFTSGSHEETRAKSPTNHLGKFDTVPEDTSLLYDSHNSSGYNRFHFALSFFYHSLTIIVVVAWHNDHSLLYP